MSKHSSSGLEKRWLPVSRSHLRDVLIVVCLLFAHPSLSSFSFGLLWFAMGLALRLWTKGVLRRNKSVTNCGPYIFCRHPFYLASLVLDLSFCIMAGLPLLVPLYVLIFLLVYLPTMGREEEWLSRHFGESYIAYQRNTPMFLAWKPRSFAHLRADWSLHVLLKEREVSRTLRLLAVPVLLFWAALAHRSWWEALEGESFLLISGALFLHLAGRVVYLTMERNSSGSQVGWARAAAFGALLLILFFGCMETWLLTGNELQRQAHRNGAVAVKTASDLSKMLSSPSKRMMVLSDGMMDEASISKHRLTVVQIFWSNFEMYFLVRPNAG